MESASTQILVMLIPVNAGCSPTFYVEKLQTAKSLAKYSQDRILVCIHSIYLPISG
ncbi:MAG: hypothetical protein QME42_05985 [bacterium]|nr:hypothetical protein [bacterium]